MRETDIIVAGQPFRRRWEYDVALDVLVGVLLRAGDPADRARREASFAEVDELLARHGLPPHREPASLADIDPPLPARTDPDNLGGRLGFSSNPAYDRLRDLARHVAVRGTVPGVDELVDPEVIAAYDRLPDRDVAFDHLLAAMTPGAVLLPAALPRVIVPDRVGDIVCLLSAPRLELEIAAMAYVIDYADWRYHDDPVVDWWYDTELRTSPFAALEVRVADDTARTWSAESHLCLKLGNAVGDVLRTGAAGWVG